MPIITIGSRPGDSGLFDDTHMDVALPDSIFSSVGDVALRGSTRENEWIIGLLRFPSLPGISGSQVIVNSARLHVFVEYGSDEAQTFALRRWYAGNGAKPDEATWNHANVSDGTPWQVPGCRGSLDRTDLVTAELQFDGSAAMPPGTEIIVTSAQMAEDVQNWMNGVNTPPAGWVIERTGVIADRGWFAFKSNESGDGDLTKPYLWIDYSVAPTAPVLDFENALPADTSVIIDCRSTQSSGTFYAVVDAPGALTGITATQIKAGLRADGQPAAFSDDSPITTTFPRVDLFGLTPSTGYSWAAVQNNANGDSNLISGSFNTLATIAGSGLMPAPGARIAALLQL